MSHSVLTLTCESVMHFVNTWLKYFKCHSLESSTNMTWKVPVIPLAFQWKFSPNERNISEGCGTHSWTVVVCVTESFFTLRQKCCVGSYLIRLQIARFVFGVRDSKQHITVAFFWTVFSSAPTLHTDCQRWRTFVILGIICGEWNKGRWSLHEMLLK